MKTLGELVVPLIFEGHDFIHNFHVVSTDFPISVDGILGRDFLKRFYANLDCDTELLTLSDNNQTFEIPLQSELHDGSFIVPPRSEVMRKINVNGVGLIKSTQLKQGVFVGNTLISEEAYVSILNTTLRPQRINPTFVVHSADDYHIFNYDVVNKMRTDRFNALLSELNFSDEIRSQKTNVYDLCHKYQDIFSLQEDVLTVNNFYRQKIRLVDDEPVFTKPYRLPQAHHSAIKFQIQKMLEEGVIEPSISPFNSPILLVPKKGAQSFNEWRLVVDYRNLNKKVVSDKFPLPRIEEILDRLGNARYFSVLDLRSGFHQIEIENESREATAFSADTGHYQFTKLPFGLKISPNSFQRMMTIAMAGLSPERTFLYIDDLIVFGKSLKEHDENLEQVFKRCRLYNLKLNPKKCKFLLKSVTYLGHLITDQGILPDPDKFIIIKQYPVPKKCRRYS